MSAPTRLVASFVPLIGLAALIPHYLAAQEGVAGGSLIIQDSPPSAPESVPEPDSSAPVIAPMKLDIARRDLKNFLVDEEALTPYRRGDGLAESLADVFVIGSNGVSHAVFWDPLACRLLGVLDLDAPVPPAAPPAETNPARDKKREKDDAESEEDTSPAPSSPYIMLATGPPPLSGSVGSRGAPQYFGFRLVAGMPEFLYTLGALSVEERLWFENEGRELKQRFSVRETSQGLRLAFPDEWKRRLSASVGTWQEDVLSVSKEESGEVILTYQLTEVAPESTESADSH